MTLNFVVFLSLFFVSGCPILKILSKTVKFGWYTRIHNIIFEIILVSTMNITLKIVHFRLLYPKSLVFQVHLKYKYLHST